MTEKATFVHAESGTRRVLQLKHATPSKLVVVFGLTDAPQLLTRTDTQDVVFAEGSAEDPYSDLEQGAEYEFSAVKSGTTSEGVPTSKPKNLRLADIQRALVCCQAVYEKTPEAVQDYLKKDMESHNFVTASVSCHGRVSYMVAETDNNEVFIAFRGTSSFQDVMDDCSIWRQLASGGPDGRQTAMGGRCHAGFRKLASTIPVDPFLKKYHAHRIVLCGHSLGGAVSHIVALNMLVELKRRGLPIDKIQSIAFGAPFFGDEGLRSYVEKQNLSDCLLTVVNQKDPVPRILRLAEAVQTAVTTTSAKVKKFVKEVKPLLTPVLKIVSSSGVGGPVVMAAAATVGTVLDQLPAAMDELDELIRQHDVTLQELNSIYRPVGWYMFITCREAPGSFRTTWEVGYMREEGQINRFISDTGQLTREKIHEHKAVCYATAFYNVTTRKEYDTVLTQPVVCNVVDSLAPEIWISRNVSMETAFPPRTNKVSLVSIASQKGDKDSGKLLVTIDGENLDFFVPLESPFTGVPYDKKKRVSVNFQSSRQVVLECYLTDGAFDPFPTITVRTHFQEIQHQTTKDEVKEVKGCTLGQLAVGRLKPELLIKSTQRCLATVMMMPESNRRKEFAKNAMISYLDKLDKSRRAVRNGKKTPELIDMVADALTGGLEELQDRRLLPVVGEIVAEVGDHLKMTYPMRLKDWVLGTLLGLTAVAGVAVTGGAGAAYIGTMAISLTGGEAIAGAAAGVIAAGAGIVGNIKLQKYFTDVERNYKGVLKTLIEELPSVQDVNEENSIRDKALDDDVYSLESALMTKYEMLGCLDKDFDYIAKSHPFESTWGKKLGTATKESQQEAVRRCQMTCDLFRIRQLLMKTCFVGLIGPQDAGKTTLIKTLWGLEEVKDIGFQEHTKTAVLYKARGTERMVIVDFPGTTTVDTQVAKLVNHCGGLASFFILVMPFTGDPSKINIDQLNKVKNFGCSFMICINQCGRFPDAFKTKENTDKFRADFSEVLDVTPSDIFFTDFVACTPEMRAVGLVGVDDVRLWIKDWLVKYDVFEKDEPELSRAVNEETALWRVTLLHLNLQGNIYPGYLGIFARCNISNTTRNAKVQKCNMYSSNNNISSIRSLYHLHIIKL
ncbi:Hypp252 [Branchiostoma lanceolatum]|uniref:Hypp252 protein n=1 Tax=Branchiostoma lanceolatum TaxID=7740 RepID=A0A8J9YIJ2_BRALA|nr:Hypp252 [Branchiostoma lanceolatum]